MKTHTVMIDRATWFETYKPRLVSAVSGSSGIMFETFGPDMDEVRAADVRQVWTLVENDGVLVISSGLHRVNSVGYYVTEMPWAGNVDVELGGADD